MLSEKITAKLRRMEHLIPLAEGKSRVAQTTDGPVRLRKLNGTLTLERVMPEVRSTLEMPYQFGRVVFINRADRPGKREALLTHLREIGWPFAAPEWHVARPGSEFTPPPDWHSTRNIWAGNLSHLQIIREAYEDRLDSVLVMEDDCLYLPGAMERVRTLLTHAPADWGMLYLGGAFTKGAKREHVGNGIHRIGFANNIESYVVHRRFMPQAIRTLTESREHADVALHRVQWDAPTYAMLPFIATQRAGWSDNFGVNKSDRQGRMSTQADCGATILSTSAKRRPLVANAAASFRRNNPSLGLHLFSEEHREGYETTLVGSKAVHFGSREVKTRLLNETPFNRGVILDDDTVTLRPLPPMESILGDCDIALAPDRISKIGALLRDQSRAVQAWLSRKEAEYTLENFNCADQWHYNTGVIFYRRTPAIAELGRVWSEEWKRFRKIDQIAFFRALEKTGVRVKLLPRALHCHTESNAVPPDTVIAHIIGRKWQMDDWLRANGLPIVQPPRLLGRTCCGAKPSVRKVAAGLARSIGGVVAALATGKPVTVAPDVATARRAICEGCEFRDGLRCGKCKCFLSIITKLNQDKCEADKWPAL